MKSSFCLFLIISLLSVYSQNNTSTCDVLDSVDDCSPICESSISPISIPLATDSTNFQVLSHSYISNSTSTLSLHDVKTGSNHILGTQSTSFMAKSNTTRYNVSSPDNGKCLDQLSEIFPLTSIGYLRCSLGGDNYAGTAFLIGNGLAVSAAHCIYDKESESFYSSPSLMFEKKTDEAFRATAQIVEAYIPYQYYSEASNSANYDWALLRLSEDNLQEKYGSLTIGSLYSLSKIEYSAYGYYSPKHTSLNAGMYVSTAYDVQNEDGFTYETYSYVNKGMSGGPVVGFYVEHDEQYLDIERTFTMIVGINSQKHYNSNGSVNYLVATKISNELITLAEVIA